MRPTLKLIARFPEPGTAKTRLIPVLGAAGAARVHRVLTERTLALLVATGCRVELHFTGAEAARFAAWLGSDTVLMAQAEGGLGARLTAALDDGPCLFFGADTPDFAATQVEAAIAALEAHDVVIGPAEDGGYWAIGMAAPQPQLFAGIDWSTAQVFAQTMAKIVESGLSATVLDCLADCDRPEDLARWPWLTA
jgi:uncharacterized protein